MCGIVAVIGLKARGLLSNDIARHILLRIEHRGDPDKVGIVANPAPHITLGCNRLAIVEREHASQPMSLPDRSVSIAFNGEIYNYRELQRELEALGHTFIAGSDTEVLLHAYKEWSTEMLGRLDGMFAFVIYDVERDLHFAARDPMGVKPLYRAESQSRIIFASEKKCLLELEAQIDEILPGHFEIGESTQRYFQFCRKPLEISDEAIVAEFKKCFDQAVAKRVQTDLPIAVIFSGGIDSSAVLGFALEHHSNITAISMGFEGSPDLEFAKRFCNERGIKQEIRYLDLDHLKSDLSNIVYFSETFEPVDITDGVLMSTAYRAASELGFKVILTGDGSDEYLAGYDLFKQSPDPEKLMEYRLGNLYRTDLQRLDRCTMRYRLEARSPFMDRELIQFTYNVPMRLKIKNGVEKWLLREACRDILPHYLRQRRKVRTPHGTGLLYQMKEYMNSVETNVAPQILENLKITESDAKYLLSEYIEHGYPIPEERIKKVGLDFHQNGFFVFENLSACHPES